MSLKFVPKCPINNIPALVQIMDWCRPGDKPLSEPMMVSLLTHICVTRPQWVNGVWHHLILKVIQKYMQPQNSVWFGRYLFPHTNVMWTKMIHPLLSVMSSVQEDKKIFEICLNIESGKLHFSLFFNDLLEKKYYRRTWFARLCENYQYWVNTVFAESPGGRLNKKDGLTRYGDSHVKDKTS